MSLTGEVKKFATEELDIDLVGITSVDRLSGAPEGHRPTDLLPGAKSVIVMAVRLVQGVVQAIFRAHEDGLRHAQCIYATYGYSLIPNLHLKFAAYRMARFLEKKGYVTTPIPSGPGGGGVPFSHRHAAVAAGLGEFGLMSIIVTPDYGPRVRFVSVITKAELEPDPLYEGPKLCDPTKCDICIKICPTNAISASKLKRVVIGGRTFEYGTVDFAKCRIGTEGLLKKTLGFKDLPIPENPTWEDIDEVRKDIDPRQVREAILIDRATWYCGKCLAYCPIGSGDQLKGNLKRG
ncbi:Epoxyqueuosine reductase [subsurface metagenome]